MRSVASCFSNARVSEAGRRLSSSICFSSSSSGFSKSSVYVAINTCSCELGRGAACCAPTSNNARLCPDQRHAISPQEVSERGQQVVGCVHAERAAAQAYRAAVLVPFLITVLAPPFYENWCRPGVRGTQRGNRARGLRLGPARCRPPECHSYRPTRPQVVERAGALDDERCLLLALIARDVSTRDQVRTVGVNHAVQLGPSLGEDQRLRRAVKVLERETRVFRPRLLGGLPVHHRDDRCDR